MILSDADFKEKLSTVVLDIFQRYAADAPEDTIRQVEDRCGISLEELNPDNAADFLECMRQELQRFMEEWKAKFVTGVIRQMIAKQGFPAR